FTPDCSRLTQHTRCGGPSMSCGGVKPQCPPKSKRGACSKALTSTLVGLRDRALIGVMIYSFQKTQKSRAPSNPPHCRGLRAPRFMAVGLPRCARLADFG